MHDLDNAGRMISTELARNRMDLGIIEVRESGIEEILLIKPANWPIAIEYQYAVKRDTLTPTSAMQIANLITVHNNLMDRVEAMCDDAQAQFKTLDTLVGGESEIVLQSANDILSAKPNVTLAIHINLHGNALLQERQRRHVTTRTLDTAGFFEKLTKTETRRQAAISDAGSRSAALRICSVAAAAIRAHPDGWGQRMRKALGLQGASDTDDFQDGVWLPLVMLGNTTSVQWRRDTLIVREGMPQTLQMAIIDKPLSVVIEHPWLPKNAVVEWTNQRMNEEMYIHASPRLGRMREPWEALHIEPAAPLMELLGIALD